MKMSRCLFIAFAFSQLFQPPAQAIPPLSGLYRKMWKWYERTYKPQGDRYVFMNDAVSIELEPGQKSRKLYTDNLDGCSVTVLFQKSNGKLKRVLLTHFNPRLKKEHLETLESNLEWEGVPRASILESLFTIILPTQLRYTTYSYEDKAVGDVKWKKEREGLECVVRNSLGKNKIEILHCEYDLVVISKDMSTSSVLICLSNDEPSYCRIYNAGKDGTIQKFNLE